MSRKECFESRYPYPPSKYGLSGVKKILSKQGDRRDITVETLWDGFVEFGLSKVPLPDKFQVLAHSTEEAYLVIKVGRDVIKYYRRSLWKVAADMIKARCKMTAYSEHFNPQMLLADGVGWSPFVGGRHGSKRECDYMYQQLKDKGFEWLWDIRPANVKFDGKILRIIDFLLIRYRNCYPMVDTYAWGKLDGEPTNTSTPSLPYLSALCNVPSGLDHLPSS